jgi:hypothetical protein
MIISCRIRCGNAGSKEEKRREEKKKKTNNDMRALLEL